MNLLSVSNVLNTVWAVLLAVFILLAMITVHEFGHYVAGKILKFKINEFSIGFGPAIFKRQSKKNGEVFALRLLPLGGYCAFAGEDEDVEVKSNQTVQAKSLEGEGADVFYEESLQNSNLTQIAQEEDTSNYFNNKAPWKRIIVLVSGALMNYLLALLLIIVMFTAFGQPVFKIDAVEQNASYQTEYSLSGGDLILQADGRKVCLITDIMKSLKGKTEGEFVTFTVLREGKKQTVEVMLRGNCDFENTSDTGKVWKALGIDIEEREDGKFWMVSSASYNGGFFYNLGSSFGYSFRIAGTIFTVLGELLTGNLGLNAVGGPVTTIKLTSQIAVQSVQSFLEIAAYIGVNLAVFNLLPIPALDGSKVVFCLIEWIFNKPVPRKIEAIIHTVGLILILVFAVMVDVLQFV